MAETTSAATPAKPAAAAPAAPPKELISPAMKHLFAQVQEQQKRLQWDDAKLCAFATQVLGPADPYKKLKIGTVDFLRRLRVGRLELLLGALSKER
jgi:ABC-type transporter MlaC component